MLCLFNIQFPRFSLQPLIQLLNSFQCAAQLLSPMEHSGFHRPTETPSSERFLLWITHRTLAARSPFGFSASPRIEFGGAHLAKRQSRGSLVNRASSTGARSLYSRLSRRSVPRAARDLDCLELLQAHRPELLIAVRDLFAHS